MQTPATILIAMSSLCKICSKVMHSRLNRNSIKLIMHPKAAYSSENCGSGEDSGGNEPCDPCQRCCSQSYPECYSRCPPPKDSSTPSVYEIRKYGHNSPGQMTMLPFEPLPPIPSGVFRCTDGESLGLGACKCCIYKNPEYFSFHHMTYYDMHQALRCYRRPSL